MSTAQRAARPVHVCPQCASTFGGTARIGNRKSVCTLCNRFSQRVRRAVSAALVSAHQKEAARLTKRIEAAVYADMFGSTDSDGDL